jgi:hypothetical protein
MNDDLLERIDPKLTGSGSSDPKKPSFRAQVHLGKGLLENLRKTPSIIDKMIAQIDVIPDLCKVAPV